jgi:hypothetical protein
MAVPVCGPLLRQIAAIGALTLIDLPIEQLFDILK